ncbi:conserved hypothetical protein [Candidatus Terasakiella magnetica]|uniref:Glycosyl transferase family 28 C-terminal domain-containing protein n=1 Tax=Candidatus Terasakiella magnetica TaxID=1867952 RepID=A0A1C3RKH3_9PROT|nr:hypothetical protein [Candidatus Terasakiella magnetica]SCA57745.1 conserved hypothetical protein [Candidatus Terasakiella magnetica]
MFHIVADITGHGLGHVGQIAPLLRKLVESSDQIKLSIRCNVANDKIEEMIGHKVDHAPPAPDVGMLMHNPYVVDHKASLKAYEELHQNFEQTVLNETQQLKELAPDLLLSDVGYCGLAAAQRLGLPNIAISSLNWADIMAGYYPQAAFLKTIKSIYQNCTSFIQTTPSLPMNWLENSVQVDPFGRITPSQRNEILNHLNLSPDTFLVLYSMGGISMGTHELQLPVVENIHWLTADLMEFPTRRTDCTSLKDLPFTFIQALSSADGIIAKPGYGIFVEAALNKTRVLYCDRHDWPEFPYLSSWLDAHTPSCCISQDALNKGHYENELIELLKADFSDKQPATTGMDQAMEVISPLVHL